MQLQEKKYRVDSFDSISIILKDAPIVRKVVSSHYYGHHDGHNVEKFVEYPDRFEIHILEESDGAFTMIDHKQIPGKDAGFAWLKEKGYTVADIVYMEYTEYDYNECIVGLYVINNFLHSIILNCLPGRHADMEKSLGLEGAELIHAPYNKYLKQLNKLQSIEL